MAGLKRTHITDYPLQEYPSKKPCSKDDSPNDDLAVTQADTLLTAIPGANSHHTMESRTHLLMFETRPPNLDSLPNEILTKIFVYSQEPSLIHVCRNTLHVLPSYVWYSSSLAMLALLGRVTVGENEEGDPSKIPKHVIWKLFQVTGPQFRLFLTTDRTDLNHSVLTSKWFSAARYELAYSRLAKVVVSAMLKYLHFDWKRSFIDRIHRQFARTKRMHDWQTLHFVSLSSAGQGQPPPSSVIISNTGITQFSSSNRQVHGMKFMGLSYIPDCLLAVPVTAYRTGLIINALSFLNTESSSRPEGQPPCSPSLLREALLEVVSRPIQFVGSPAHKDADDTFRTLLSLDKIASISVKGPPVVDEELFRAVLSNNRVFYLYQILRAFAGYKHFTVQTLKVFEDARRRSPSFSKDCQSILIMELMTRAILRRAGPPPEKMMQSLSYIRSFVDAETKYRYLRLSHLPHRNEDQIFTVAVYYTRGGRWLYGGSWHVPGAERLYKTMARWTTYGRKATLRSYDPTLTV